MMLYRIAVNYRLYFQYPPTSMAGFRDENGQIPIESPLSNSVASFRKWIKEDLGIEEIFPQNPHNRYGLTVKFSKEPYPNNFVHDDRREFLSDDALLQYDEVVYVSIMREVA